MRNVLIVRWNNLNLEHKKLEPPGSLECTYSHYFSPFFIYLFFILFISVSVYFFVVVVDLIASCAYCQLSHIIYNTQKKTTVENGYERQIEETPKPFADKRKRCSERYIIILVNMSHADYV